MEVRRGWLHVPQRQIALLMQVEPGRETHVHRPLVGGGDVADLGLPLRSTASASQSSRVAVRRLVAARSATRPDGRRTRTRSRSTCRRRRAARARSITSWSGPWAAPRVRRSMLSISSMSPADPCRTRSMTGIAERSTVPAQEHLRVQREAGLPVAPGGLGVRGRGEHPAQAAPAVVERGRRAAPGRCPVPGPAAGRRTSPGSTSARGCTTSRSPPSRRRPRPPSSRRGRCSRKCRVRIIQACPRSGERGWGSGQDARNIRHVQLQEPVGLSRSAVGRSASVIGRMVAVGHEPDPMR